MTSARRACLSVPGSEARIIEKALRAGADEVVIDLEDAVAADAKAQARVTVVDLLTGLDADGPTIVVRVNAPGTPWCHDDLAAMAGAAGPLWGVVLPKVESPGDLHFAERLLDGAEAATGRSVPLRIEALLETARGIGEAYAIAASSSRLSALILGYADLAASLGRTGAGRADGAGWLHARETVLVAARARGLQAIDGPILSVSVDEDFLADTSTAPNLGWDGRWAIHPRQVPALVEAFTPSSAEATWARRVVEALTEAEAEGRGAVALDGQMLDEAVRRSALGVLVRTGGPA